MQKLLVIQTVLPPYRDFLWKGLRQSFQLFLAETSTHTLILPDGRSVTLKNFICSEKFDYLVLPAGSRDLHLALWYIFKYRPNKVIGWTQFCGKNKSFIIRFIKQILLCFIFDRILLYYEHEIELFRFYPFVQNFPD